MPAAAASLKGPYHHGGLHDALVGAAFELAREEGPEAIVLREAARRVGVSATAAYRHFADRADLVDAVAGECRRELGESMQRQLARLGDGRDEREDAWAFLKATGRGYVQFALDSPGLFAAAFANRKEGEGGRRAEMGEDLPRRLLEAALDRMLDAGLLDPKDRELASIQAWASVHGLSVLLLGALRDVPAKQQAAVIDGVLDLVGHGLIIRP